MESQSADAEAPPPPKPDLRYSGLPPADTEGERCISYIAEDIITNNSC